MKWIVQARPSAFRALGGTWSPGRRQRGRTLLHLARAFFPSPRHLNLPSDPGPRRIWGAGGRRAEGSQNLENILRELKARGSLAGDETPSRYRDDEAREKERSRGEAQEPRTRPTLSEALKSSLWPATSWLLLGPERKTSWQPFPPASWARELLKGNAPCKKWEWIWLFPLRSLSPSDCIQIWCLNGRFLCEWFYV